MKKFLPVFFVLILGILVFLPKKPDSVFALSSQEFQQAYQEYITASSVYQSDYEKFVLSRSKYLTFKSISSESEAIDSTKKMILSRIDFLVKYLTALRMRLALETNILDYQENLLYLQLDNELTSLLNSKELVNSTQDLKGLVEIESDAGKKYQTISKLAYKSLGLINYHQILKVAADLRKQVDLLNSKLEEYGNLRTYDLTNSKKRFEQTDGEFKDLERKMGEDRKNFFNLIDSQDNLEKAYSDYKNSVSTKKGEILNFFSVFEEILFLIKKT